MSISVIQTMVLTQITHIRSYLNLVGKPSRTTLMLLDFLHSVAMSVNQITEVVPIQEPILITLYGLICYSSVLCGIIFI